MKGVVWFWFGSVWFGLVGVPQLHLNLSPWGLVCSLFVVLLFVLLLHGDDSACQTNSCNSQLVDSKPELLGIVTVCRKTKPFNNNGQSCFCAAQLWMLLRHCFRTAQLWKISWRCSEPHPSLERKPCDSTTWDSHNCFRTAQLWMTFTSKFYFETITALQQALLTAVSISMMLSLMDLTFNVV